MNSTDLPKNIKILADKWLKGTLTQEESEELEAYYSTASLPEIFWNTEDRNEGELKNRLFKGIMSKLPEIKPLAPKASSYALWKKLTVAATFAAVLLGTTIIFYLYKGKLTGKGEAVTIQKDIRPGTEGATITLANGKVIKLNGSKDGVVVDGKIHYNDGSEVGSNAKDKSSDFLEDEPIMLVASTDRGQVYRFVLPDGSNIWLNAESKLNFPSRFTGKERRVQLIGEGYFEIAKDPNHPFIVESNGQSAVVLGTHFNISAYPDETATKTTLVEGSLKVNNTLLVPNQQLLLKNGEVSVLEVDPENEIDWKYDTFTFQDKDFRTLMRKVARWYDVEIVYDESAPQDIELGGWGSRKSNISAVLKWISSTNKVRFKVEGRRVTVMK